MFVVPVWTVAAWSTAGPAVTGLVLAAGFNVGECLYWHAGVSRSPPICCSPDCCGSRAASRARNGSWPLTSGGLTRALRPSSRHGAAPSGGGAQPHGWPTALARRRAGERHDRGGGVHREHDRCGLRCIRRADRRHRADRPRGPSPVEGDPRPPPGRTLPGTAVALARCRTPPRPRCPLPPTGQADRARRERCSGSTSRRTRRPGLPDRRRGAGRGGRNGLLRRRQPAIQREQPLPGFRPGPAAR